MAASVDAAAAAEVNPELLSRLLRGYDPIVIARGREYATDGRVTGVRRDGDAVSAFVRGSSRYAVMVARLETGDLVSDCTCMAYARASQCKHLAALVWTLQREAAAAVMPRRGKPEPLPEIFRRAFAASKFFERLSLYAGARLGAQVERWLPLADFWHRTNADPTDAAVLLRKRVLQHAPEIERELELLRTWTPPDTPLPHTAFGKLYAKLADDYVAHRGAIKIGRGPAGPIDDARHPGFTFAYDAKRRAFEARERLSPLLPDPDSLAVTIPLAPGVQPHFDDGAMLAYGETDAWALFALRAMLLALHERTDAAVVELEDALARPVWDHVLEQLTGRAPATAEPREWTFTLLDGYGGSFLRLVAHARRASPTAGGKTLKWKKQSFEALYAEESTPLERAIARAALMSLERTTEVPVRLGTAHGHEVLRLLAQHPRTLFCSTGRADPENDPRAEIVTGDVTMRLERAPSGDLAPRFLVGNKELSAAMLCAADAGSGGFRGLMRGVTLISAFVPPALRPWLAAADKLGASLAFPPEAATKLVAAAEPLVAAGVAELPRDALGAELHSEPRPALRVEWHKEGAAVVEIFIAACPGAPLVAPGLGPTMLTFVKDGRRVFVERELERERQIVEDARAHITAPILWELGRGRTESLEEALALAEWLDRNPLGLAIEVTVGRPPSVVAWVDATRSLEVRAEGSWLVLDGALKVSGVKLTVGDVLDAARLARRYVKASDGLFLELSREAIAMLEPVAIACDLGEQSGGAPRVHHAFGAIVAEARTVFGTVCGLDLEPYAKRFQTRERSIRVPSLEHGKLRPYQREGVAWMLRLATWAPGCVLADDMGLGKTVQTAAVLKARASLGPALIVAPASVSSNWMVELARFMPSLRVSWFNDDREIAPADLGPGDVLVVSYGLLQRCVDLFSLPRWATVVVDEAQYVKNVLAQRTDAIRALQRDFTIALTGTPLENHLGELFSIVDLVFPSLLGTEQTFRDRFRRPIEGGRDGTRLAVLGRLLSPFLLRRTRESVLDDLPPREEITETIDLGPEETKRYLALRRACEMQFAKRKKGETAAQLKIALFAALTRLRQLACDVRLLDPTYQGTSTKIARTVELCTELAAEGNRALVFSSFTQFLEKIRDGLVAAGLRVAYLAGDTPTTKRRAVIDAFQAGEYDVFCVSLLAGGTGLNLTKASYVIHTDPWWNPAAEEQATSRAHRIGQSDPVTVYRLVARGTIEEAVLAMHASKKELAAAVLDGKSSAKAITSEELLDLLRFGGDSTHS